MKFSNKSSKKYMSLKLDMIKGYNRVEWDFLKAIISKLGFSDKWVTTVIHFVTLVSYSILINGEACANFFPSKGL